MHLLYLATHLLVMILVKPVCVGKMRNFKKNTTVLFLIFLPFVLNGSYLGSCKLDNDIIYCIATAEHCKKRDVGYPYIISFNNKKDISYVKTIAKFAWIDNRSIECFNKTTCTDILHFLNKSNIYNLDLGAFQINRNSHKLDNDSDYFDIKKSYTFACNYIYQNIKRNGYSWDSIARYHSSTPKHKIPYKKKLIKIYNRLKKEGRKNK